MVFVKDGLKMLINEVIFHYFCFIFIYLTLLDDPLFFSNCLLFLHCREHRLFLFFFDKCTFLTDLKTLSTFLGKILRRRYQVQLNGNKFANDILDSLSLSRVDVLNFVYKYRNT